MSGAKLSAEQVVRIGPAASVPVAVTVVIATFNRPEGLRGVLADLETQKAAMPFEVVVVDDGGGEPVLGWIGDSYTFPLLCVRRVNGGPGQARHSGIQRASGEIIVIVDDDMHLPEGFLDAHFSLYEQGADVVLGHIKSPDDPSLPLFERFHTQALERVVQEYERGESKPEGIRLCTGNVSFRKSAYEAVGGFDLSLKRCEDRDLGLRLEVSGYRFAFAPEAWSTHQSDHEDVSVWRKRSRLFGELDTKISRKHPSHRAASPWSFFPKLPRVVRPALLAAACAPRFGSAVGSSSYRLGVRIEQAGRGKLAMTFASLCYAMEYFAGVGTAFESPRLRRVVASWRNFSNSVTQ